MTSNTVFPMATFQHSHQGLDKNSVISKLTNYSIFISLITMCIIKCEHEILARIMSVVSSEFSNLNFYLEKMEVKTNKLNLRL